MKKRLVSFILCAAMLLSPTPVFSAEVESTATSVPTVMETLAPTATAANDAVCNCAATCTQDQMDVSCPICGAENAVAEQCAFVAPTAVPTEAPTAAPVEAPQAEPVLLSATGEGDVLPFTQDTVSVENVTYTGSALAPVLKAGGKTLTAGTDYRITSTTPTGDAINAGSYTYTFEGMGSYEGSFTAEWKILRKEITESMISVGILLYTGNAQDAPITVKDGDKTLVKNRDYELYDGETYGVLVSNSNYVCLQGVGNYSGTVKDIHWSILSSELTKDNIIVYDSTYTGSVQNAPITVMIGDTELEEGVAYSLSGELSATNAGIYTATVTGLSPLSGSVQVEWKIDPRPFTEDMITITSDLTYNGSYQAPKVVVKCGDKTLTRNNDYELVGSRTAINAGTYKVSVRAVSSNPNFSGQASGLEWSIAPKPITADMITVDELTFNGSGQAAPITVKDGDKTLVVDTDYQLSLHTSSYSAGSYKSHITGKGNYTGKIENVAWEIKPKAITADMITVGKLTYNGFYYDAPFTLKDGDKTLVKDTDYRLIGSINAQSIGPHQTSVEGIGNYSGKVEDVEWMIDPISIEDCTITITNPVYNGTAQKPTVSVKAEDGTLLVEGADYYVNCNAETDVSSTGYVLTVTGRDIYGSSTGELSWNIEPYPLTQDMIDVSDTEFVFDNVSKSPTVKVMFGDEELTAGVDFTLTGNTAESVAGNYTIGVQGKGNFSGSLSDYAWSITPIALTEAMLDCKSSVVYSGESYSAAEDIIALKLNGLPIAETEYSLSGDTSATNVGSYTTTITGTGNLIGTLEWEWEITPKAITEDMIDVGELTFNGKNQDAPITVKDGDKTLVEDTDYELSLFTGGYSAKSYTITVTGKGNYTGEIENIEWKIKPKKITEDMIVTRVYNGQEQLAALKDGDTMLERDKDYAVYGTVGVTNVGSYDVNFQGKGNYTGTLVHARWKIVPKEITEDMVSVGTLTYDGSKQAAPITIKMGDMTLVKDTDYTLSGDVNAIDANSYSVTITGKGNYTGTLEDIAWSISPMTLTDSMIDRSASDVTYDGDSHSPNLIIKRGDTPLIKDTDYTIDGDTPKTDVGSYTVSVSGKGNYTGTVENIVWHINANTPSKDDLIIGSSFTYDGTEKSPTLKLKVGEKTLNKGTDYILTGDAAKTDAGTYKATVTFIGNYSGSLDVDWEIERTAQTINLAGIDETNSLKGVYGGSYSIQPINAHGKVDYAVNTRSAVVNVNENGKLSFLRSGSATVTVSAAGDTNYLPAERTISVEVSKAPLTIIALDKTAYIGGEAPDLSAPVLNKDYRIEGLMEGDTFDITIELFYDTTPDMTQEGEYTIEISTHCEDDDRYELISLKQGKLTVCEKPSYTITATAGAHGSITPSGAKIVKKGDKISFKITPDAGYVVADLKIDGKRVRSATSYTFEDVSANHRIEVTFMPADGNPQTGVDVSAED